MFKRYPRILSPFFVVLVTNILILYILYLIPQKPISYLLAPPVRVFWGEKFLHYPFNLFLLPKLFYYANILSTSLIGVLMTALAIGMIKESYLGYIPTIGKNLFLSLRKYFTLLMVWIVILVLSETLTRIFRSIEYRNHSLFISYLINSIGIFIQLFFIYTMPAIVVEDRKFFSGLKENFSFLKNVFLTTFTFILLPTLFYFPLLGFNKLLPSMIERFFPEVIIIFILASIFISTIIDILITTASTLIFLKKRVNF
ncbi:MAG: hypothetical protein NC817_01965 [Candidatus Omnitrophica bacterium]|nr:hypothetical protein [Candidatus Omnitrophota bacterium]MCM8826567.1 hypothetical protein [Candidatus Omnitrophota bacterium]